MWLTVERRRLVQSNKKNSINHIFIYILDYFNIYFLVYSKFIKTPLRKCYHDSKIFSFRTSQPSPIFEYPRPDLLMLTVQSSSYLHFPLQTIPGLSHSHLIWLCGHQYLQESNTFLVLEQILPSILHSSSHLLVHVPKKCPLYC